MIVISLLQPAPAYLTLACGRVPDEAGIYLAFLPWPRTDSRGKTW